MAIGASAERRNDTECLRQGESKQRSEEGPAKCGGRKLARHPSYLRNDPPTYLEIKQSLVLVHLHKPPLSAGAVVDEDLDLVAHHFQLTRSRRDVAQ